MNRFRGGWRAVAAGAIVVGAGLLGGCSSPGASALTRFQDQVMEITESSAAADWQAALAALDRLEGDVDAAFAREEISRARHLGITAVIELVRQDLEAAIAAEELEDENDEADGGNGGDNGSGNNGNDGNGNNGNGNNGNGNGDGPGDGGGGETDPPDPEPTPTDPAPEPTPSTTPAA